MTMDASHDSLRRLIAVGASSLLQYVSESAPWFPRESAGVLQTILGLAREERDEIARFIRWLQKKHVRVPVLGSFPSYFTTMNFVTLDYLLPKLVAHATDEIAQVERLATQAENEETHALIQGFLVMKRRHLQTLTDLAAPKTPVPV